MFYWIERSLVNWDNTEQQLPGVCMIQILCWYILSSCINQHHCGQYIYLFWTHGHDILCLKPDKTINMEWIHFLVYNTYNLSIFSLNLLLQYLLNVLVRSDFFTNIPWCLILVYVPHYDTNAKYYIRGYSCIVATH